MRRSLCSSLWAMMLAGILIGGLVLGPATLLAADTQASGEDNSSNDMTGGVTYSRNACWDGTYWDRQLCTGTGAPTYVRLQDGATATLAAFAAGVAANGLRVAPPTDAYFMISRTSAANAQSNPIYTVVSDDTSANSGTNPISVQITDGVALRTPPWAKADDDDGANEIAIDTTDADYTLPAAGWYEVTAAGNSACILCGASPTAVFNTTCPIRVSEGATRRVYLTGPKCSVIGPSVAGYVYFLHLNPAL